MPDNHAFRDSVRRALANGGARETLRKFAADAERARDAAYQSLDFAAIRRDIAAIRAYGAANLEKLARDFETSAKELGAIVYRARNADDANRYITSLAQDLGIEAAVKAKSMTAEEIGLNRHLEEAGIAVTETDLGEWIIHLLGEKPSHMVLPAIHLSKEEVAKYIGAYLGRPVEPVIKDMVALVRAALRPKFLEAGMGITGANLLAADTGSIFIASNEGNARLAANVPKVHLVLAGYEKLVPTLDECFRIVEALPKSATGQNSTSYVTMVTGNPPYLDSYGEKGKELHIVLLDNGRLDLQKNADFRPALHCIGCGACLNVCPVYLLVGGQVFGHVRMGPIGSILTAFTAGASAAKDIQSLCIACGRCKEVCPAGIDLPGLIMRLREDLADGGNFTERLVLRHFLTRPKTMKVCLSLGAKLQKPLLDGDGYFKKLPLPHGIGNVLAPPGLKPPLSGTFKNIEQKTAGRCEVALFGGCLVNALYPRIGEAMVKVLNQYGIRATYPANQGCCGAPAYYLGDKKSAQKMARAILDAFEKGDHEFILTPCPTCTAFIQNRFVDLLPEGPLRERGKKIRDMTVDFTAFIAGIEKEMNLLKRIGIKGKVTYHDSCHYKRSLGLADKPRFLLAKIAVTREMAEADACCGFGGAYLFKHPEISGALAEKKCGAILQSGADTVATDCPGCILQISGGLKREGLPIRTKHTAELLAEYFS